MNATMNATQNASESKSGIDTNLAAAALAIALVALITALGQLLQQYFATADGYRRCQKSVMGGYARKTRLRWRWREFRFETLYTVPEIFLVGHGAPDRENQVILAGNATAREKSMVPLGYIEETSDTSPKLDRTYQAVHPDSKELRAKREQMVVKGLRSNGVFQNELACWVPLLHWIHESSKIALTEEHCPVPSSMPLQGLPPRVRLPAVTLRELSWDFQPPDVVRPLAKTTLFDIAVIARRMGMKWKDFRPSDGILRAEGHSHTITSTTVRSLGIVLQYSFTAQGHRLRRTEGNLRRAVPGSLLSEQEEIYIPNAKSDRLGCGVVRSAAALSLPDFSVSTQSEIITALSFLDDTGISSRALTQILKENPEYHFRVADIVAFTAAPVRSRGSSLVQVPAPSDNVHGVTTSLMGRVSFRQCIEQYIMENPGKVGPLSRSALGLCNEIRSKYPAWDYMTPQTVHGNQWVVTRDVAYLDFLHEHCLEITTKFAKMEEETSLRYHNLLGVHIRMAMFCEEGETSPLRSWGTDYVSDIKGYFKVLPQIVKEMLNTVHVGEEIDEETVFDAWI
ncbi:hypothetical protein B0J14DRAFT_93715 [Halenospora varia]|nr:hypothetical protein B0J14DRAFT_93715 [Halenospora varia]